VPLDDHDKIGDAGCTRTVSFVVVGVFGVILDILVDLDD
jgi:hypothetical protein